MTVDRLNRRLCARSLKTLGALGGGRAGLGWDHSGSAAGAILTSASTIVVALNAQLLRRVDLRPNQA